MVFIGEESSKRRLNAYIPKYISMAYYIMFLWIPGREGTRGNVAGNFLVNALHAFHETSVKIKDFFFNSQFISTLNLTQLYNLF